MSIFCETAWKTVKTITPILVKSRWVVGVLFLSLNLFAADLGETLSSDESSSTVSPHQKRKILARTYPVKVSKYKNSQKFYRVEADTEKLPKPGYLILIKAGSQPVVGLRILRVNTKNKILIAKSIKDYPNLSLLESKSLIAVEKLSDGDLIPEVPAPIVEVDEPVKAAPETPSIAEVTAEAEAKPSVPAQPTEPAEPEPTEPADPIEVEASESAVENTPLPEISDYDPELDSETSPPPGKSTDEDSDHPTNQDKDDLPEEDSKTEMGVTEVEPLDPNYHWLSLGFGFLRNMGPTGGSYYFSSVQAKYGLTLAKTILFQQNRLQDSIAVDLGIYSYKTINFITQGDSYSLLAGGASLRYNLLFGKTFGIFFYGGAIKHRVTSSAQGDPDIIQKLSAAQLSAGTGLLIQLGPNWYTRVDLGIDNIGLGLLIRF